MGGRVTNTVAAQTMGGTIIVVKPTLISRMSTLMHGAAFVAGFTFFFVTFGLITTAFVFQIGGQNVALVREIIGRVGGLLIIFFGLHFMGIIPSLLRRLLAEQTLIGNPIFSLAFALIAGGIIVWAFVDWLIALPVLLILFLWMVLGGAFSSPERFWTNAVQSLQTTLYADTRRQMVASGQQSYSSSALMGIIFAAGWTPCIGPIYGTILTMAMTGDEIRQAVILLIAYSLGLGIPFLLTATLLDRAQSLLRKMQRHLHKVELVSGAFLVVIGILVATGRLQSLSQNFANQFADFSYNLEDCVISVTQGEIAFGDLITCINNASTEPATTDANSMLIKSELKTMVSAALP
jgi:cytochrome c-type biogenesis protein